jgi:hypothetical protein
MHHDPARSGSPYNEIQEPENIAPHEVKFRIPIAISDARSLRDSIFVGATIPCWTPLLETDAQGCRVAGFVPRDKPYCASQV